MDYQEQSYETKGERREKKRHKSKTSQVGTPWTKIRMSGNVEATVRLQKIRKAKRAKRRNEETVDIV